MTAIYIMLTAIIVLLIAAIILLIVKKGKSNAIVDKKLNCEIKENLASTKSDIIETLKMSNQMNGNTFDLISKNVEKEISSLAKQVENFAQGEKQSQTSLENRMLTFMSSVDRKLEEMRADNIKSLNDVRLDNEKQLSKIRETVDEKLSSTLEERFNSSFELVGKRLEEINRSFMEMQSLQSGVNDLKKIFANVKQRGTWGEIALDNLLSQILTKEQYSKNVNISQSENERVDFVVNLPGKNEETVYLPIDAKFPIEDYLKLVEASERGNITEIDEASKGLERRIKLEAQSIKNKYILPPKTTDFAILYLPIEGLYAEVVKQPNMLEDLQNKYRVVICGPTTLAALLNSLQMGFRSVAIEKRSGEIRKLLEQFRKDFVNFSDLLSQTKKKLEGVQTTIDNAGKRTEMIKKRLSTVATLPSDNIDLIETTNDLYGVEEE